MPSARHGGPLAAALLAATVLVTGCTGDEHRDAAPAHSTAPGTAGGEDDSEPDLASGLLPASAFGPDAAVVAVDPEQLLTGMGVVGDEAAGTTVTPESCRTAVQVAGSAFGDSADIAAVSATTGVTVTVEVLVRRGPIKGAVRQIAGIAERCPEVTVSSPQIGRAVLTFEALPVDDLGDRAALLRYTTAVTLPDGSRFTVPALVGAVQDGDRLLELLSMASGEGTGAVIDPVSFAELLAQAYQVQAAALD